MTDLSAAIADEVTDEYARAFHDGWLACKRGDAEPPVPAQQPAALAVPPTSGPDGGFGWFGKAPPAECNECKATPCAVPADQEPVIAGPSNYYGALEIRCKDGVTEWCVESYDGHQWEPCPLPVYFALLAQLGEEMPSDPQLTKAVRGPESGFWAFSDNGRYFVCNQYPTQIAAITAALDYYGDDLERLYVGRTKRVDETRLSDDTRIDIGLVDLGARYYVDEACTLVVESWHEYTPAQARQFVHGRVREDRA